MEVGDGVIQRAEPLRVAVHRRVVRMVTEGDLAPGQGVTEAGLSATLGVSRTPVREALLQLEAEGVLRSTPAKGFTVRELTRQEAGELFPIMAALEALAVRTASPDLTALRAIQDDLEAATAPVELLRLDTAFHQAIVASCGNASLCTLSTQVRVSVARYELGYLRNARNPWPHRSGDEHGAILDALTGGDTPRAAEAITRNWQESLRAVRTWLDSKD